MVKHIRIYTILECLPSNFTNCNIVVLDKNYFFIFFLYILYLTFNPSWGPTIVLENTTLTVLNLYYLRMLS